MYTAFRTWTPLQLVHPIPNYECLNLVSKTYFKRATAVEKILIILFAHSLVLEA